jgi:hypothetical protein
VNAHAIVDPAVLVEEPAPGRFVSFDSTDVQTGLVSLVPTLNGAPFVASPTNWAQWAVVGADGDETPIGSTLTQPYARSLVHGTYHVLYQWQNGYNSVPGNTNARVATDLVVAGPTSFAFDLPMAGITVEPLLNGDPWPLSPTEYGDLDLQGSEPEDRFALGSTYDGLEIQRLVITGSYELIYDHRNGGTTVPVNEGEPILSFHTSDARVIGVDVVATRVAPTLMLDGQAFPIDGGNQARIVLRSPPGGEASLGTTDQAPLYPRRVIDGAYRIDYEWLSGDGIPRNSREPVGVASVPEPGFLLGLGTGIALLAATGRSCRRSSLVPAGGERRGPSARGFRTPARRGSVRGARPSVCSRAGRSSGKGVRARVCPPATLSPEPGRPRAPGGRTAVGGSPTHGMRRQGVHLPPTGRSPIQ